MNRTTCPNQGMPAPGCSSPLMTGNTTKPMDGTSHQMRKNPQGGRRGDCSCGCAAENTLREEPCVNDWKQKVPTGNQQKLLMYIDQVSFGAYEAMLYLDTHPEDQEALAYFHEKNEKRNFALKEHARLFGPLNPANIGRDCNSSWEWANQPWPWEGGNC